MSWQAAKAAAVRRLYISNFDDSASFKKHVNISTQKFHIITEKHACTQIFKTK